MTYTFPKVLSPLRVYLRGQGADVKSFVTDRQAAFMAQQLLGTRIKFPPNGSDMRSTLLLIQDQLSLPGLSLPVKSAKVSVKQGPKGGRSKSDKHHKVFTADMFIEGVHIFCDGAAVPNPGVGGWGVVVYEDGKEIGRACGGDPEATNNQMELTALLNAIGEAWKLVAEYDTVTIWCDSQYCVNGVNDWMKGWKANGWLRGGAKSEPKNRVIMNVDLWKAIDDALLGVPEFGQVVIKWVKGHAGIIGNERADELAEQGREAIIERAEFPAGDELEARYRQIMGAM